MQRNIIEMEAKRTKCIYYNNRSKIAQKNDTDLIISYIWYTITLNSIFWLKNIYNWTLKRPDVIGREVEPEKEYGGCNGCFNWREY